MWLQLPQLFQLLAQYYAGSAANAPSCPVASVAVNFKAGVIDF